MQRHLLLGLAGLPALLSAQRVSVTCSFATVAANGETCNSMAASWGLDTATFESLNPKAKCPEVIGGEQYCVVGTVTTVTGEPTTAPTTTSTQTTTTTTTTEVTSTTVPGQCINTDCSVGSLDIAAAGVCPDGEVQISYWEQPGCQGKWFGYGYAKRGECRGLWTNGWKFKAMHLRCAKSQDDCVNKGSCVYDPEPAQGVCQVTNV
ncbi:hypothetical protein MY4038_009484 [Beauveria bassiana]